MTQANLLEWRPRPKLGTKARFDGPAYSPRDDDKRLSDQLERIKALMLDGHWRTLAQISEHTGAPQASVSAQLRHLRKPRFGGYTVERRGLGRGLHEYRVLEPTEGVPCAQERKTMLRELKQRVAELEQLVRDMGGRP